MKYFKEVIIALLVVIICIGAVCWSLQYSNLRQQIVFRPVSNNQIPQTNIKVFNSPPPVAMPETPPQASSTTGSLSEQVLDKYTSAPFYIKYSSVPNNWSLHIAGSSIPTNKYKIVFLSTGKMSSCAGLNGTCFVILDSMDLEGYPPETNQPKMLGELSWGFDPIYSSVKYIAPDKIDFQTSTWWPGGEGAAPDKNETITNWEVDLVNFKMNKLNSYTQSVKN